METKSKKLNNIISELNRDELDHVMGVLNRDRTLRDQEQERIVRMRLDLIREKRMGALVVGRKYTTNPDSRCGRCQGPLDLSEKLDRNKSRCFICKHLVCKRCRVQKWRNEWEQARARSGGAENIRRMRTSSDPVVARSVLPPSTISSLARASVTAALAREPVKNSSDAVTQTDITWVHKLSTGADSSQCPSCGRGSPSTPKSASSVENAEERPSPRAPPSSKSATRRSPRVRSRPPSPSGQLQFPERTKRRANTFSSPGGREAHQLDAAMLRSRRNSTSPKGRRTSACALESAANVAGVFALMPDASRPPIIVANARPRPGTSVKKVEPARELDQTLNPFEEGYVDPPTPPVDAMQTSGWRKSSSDRLNPFLEENNADEADTLNPFLSNHTALDLVETQSSPPKPRTIPKANLPGGPKAADSVGASRFLMMAGVTPPRSAKPPGQKPASKGSPLTPSFRRKLEFGSGSIFNRIKESKVADGKNVSTEQLLSSSFTDLRSSLKRVKMPALSFLQKPTPAITVINAAKSKEAEQKKLGEAEKTKSESEASDTPTETDTTTESATDNQTTDRKSTNVTATASSDDDTVADVSEDELVEDEDKNETYTEASEEESGEEVEVEEIEEDVETPTKEPSVTKTEQSKRAVSPIQDVIQSTPLNHSLSDSVISSLSLAILPMEIAQPRDFIRPREHVDEDDSTQEEEVQSEESDYSSEEERNSAGNSGAEDADLESDGSPLRSVDKRDLGDVLSLRGDVVLPAEPVQRKGTRDSGYMTPDEISRLRRSPVQKAGRAFGAVERRAASRKAVEDITGNPLKRASSFDGLSTIGLYEPRRPASRTFSSADKSDAESVKSDVSAASVTSVTRFARALPNLPWSNVRRATVSGREPEWICRVCYKTLEMHKKSGDWFRQASKTSPKYVPRARRPLSRSNSALTPPVCAAKARVRDVPANHLPPSVGSSTPQPLKGENIASAEPVFRQSEVKTSTPKPQALLPAAPVASTTALPFSHMNGRPFAAPSAPMSAAVGDPSRITDLKTDQQQSLNRSPMYQAMSVEAAKKSWVKPRSKDPDLGEKIRAEIQKIVPDLAIQSNQGSSKFSKKKSTITPSSVKPAEISNGPDDITVVRGNPISLCCELKGTPPLTVVWRKGRDEIKHSSQCNIESTRTLSALTIAKSERDDSGCYTLQVKNVAGVDQFSVSVKVVDVPDPPGKPFAESSRGNDIVVSWYGSGYDGGSHIISYVLETCKVWDNGGGRKTWTEVTTTNSTSHTVTGLEVNAAYMFRVSAQNAYGVSKPGPACDIVRNVQPAMENGADSSEDEDESNFVKYEPVVMRQNEKFSTKYEIHEKLGQGRFGKVHRVTDRATGVHYAAKIMRALKVKDKEAVSLEIEIMNRLRHPKLVQLIDAFSHGREVTMVMDLVAGGELFERVIDEDFELTEAACIKYMRQICAGVQFMHSSHIVHLDLKPENIMCINKTGTQIKLIDFGLARKFNPNETIRVMFGTPEFVAPEVINYDAIGFQTDMWSVGVICYILLSGLSPFSGDADSETLSNITAVQWDFDDEAFDQISDDAKDFISRLLVKSLKNRYTVDKALGHQWLKKDTKKMSKSKLNTKNLKRFLARRKWQKTGNAVRALGRLASLARLSTSSSSSSMNAAGSSQRESGFLSALKAQLVRERETEVPEKRKPEFVKPFDDVEVVVGSAARFQCTVTGVPDPEIIWYKDGKPIKESRHFRISYNEDDICTLLISDASPSDDAEYTCKAMNTEGTAEHSAELIVISPVEKRPSSLTNSPLSSRCSFSSCSSHSSLTPPEYAVVDCLKEGETAVFSFALPRFNCPSKTQLQSNEAPSVCWYKEEERECAEDSGNLSPLCSDESCVIETFVCDSNDSVSMSSYLVLNGVTKKHAGSYICKATDGKDELQLGYSLIVADGEFFHRKTKCVPPRFVKVSRNQVLPEGSDAILKCTVVGKPAPIIQWYMYGTRLYPGERHRFNHEGSNASLFVLATRWYDSAKYECRAISPLGTNTCSVDLCVQPADHQEVEFEGAPIFLLRTESAAVKAGSHVTFRCTIAGTPHPKVHWKHGNHVVSSRDPHYVTARSQGGAYSLSIKRVCISDGGKYTCVAENDKGVALCGAYLMVGQGGETQGFTPFDVLPLAPVFVTRPYSATVRCGYSAAFQCTVHGVPQAKLTWHKMNGRDLSSDGHYVIEDVKSHHTLRIPKTDQSDHGFYFCTASNSAGEVSCSMKLDVSIRENAVPPSLKFGSEAMLASGANCAEDGSSANQLAQNRSAHDRKSSTSKAVTLTAGKNAKISLAVRGTPEPEVTWYKGGIVLKTGNRLSLHKNHVVHQLRIARVQWDDQGLYSVLACNAGGLFTALIQISVKDRLLPSIFARPPNARIAAHEGADAVIQCQLKVSKKNEPATWWKEDQMLDQKKTDKYEMKAEGTLRQLTVKSAAKNDSGEYKCQVGNQFASGRLLVHSNRSDEDQRSLKILSERHHNSDPSVDQGASQVRILSLPAPAMMEVPENGTLILQHRISEDVEGCSWSLAGREMHASERCKISSKDGKHSLMLMNVKPEDAGDVVFRVPGTNLSITTSLRVQALPCIPDAPRVKRHAERDVTVTWTPAKGSGSDLQYVVEMRTDKIDQWKEVDTVKASVGQYTVTSLEPGTGYSFRLKGHNQAGFGPCCEASTEIVIPKKTTIIQPLEDISIIQGETARFNVQLSTADCAGKWFLNGLKLEQRGETCQMMTSGNAHSLMMRNLTKTGSASVQFVTDDGKLTSSAHLVVKAKSVCVIQAPSDVTVTENAEASFTVALSKSVNKLGKWYLKGNELKHSHDVVIEKRGEFQILNLRNIKSGSSGEISFVLIGEPQTACSCQLTVLSWFEIEPFQKIGSDLPEVTSAVLGDDVVFVVKLSSDGKCRSTWTHCGIPVPPKSKKYKIKQHGDEIHLTIRNVCAEDAGTIQCTVDKQKTSSELKLELGVQEIDGPPDQPKNHFTDEANLDNNLHCDEGDHDVTLTCKVTDPDTKVKWIRNGEEIDISSENVTVVDEGCVKKLVFSEIKPQDGGTYDCVIISDADDVTDETNHVDNDMKRSFEIFVKENIQSITSPLPDEIMQTEGDTLTLTIKVTTEDAAVSWFRDGLMMSASNDEDARIQMLKPSGLERQLVIKDLTCADSGIYSCETLHDFSTAMVKIAEPIVEVLEKLSDFSCEELDTVSFQTRLSRVPKGSPQWKLNGRRLTNNEDCLITSNENLYSVTLRNVKLKDGGHVAFQCGDIQDEAKLTVKPPPVKFVKRLSDVVAQAGLEAILVCEISRAESTVRWFIDADEVTSDDRISIIRDGTICKLKLKNVAFEDEILTFKCKTKSDSTSCKIKVEKPVLSVLEGLDDVTVIEGEKASFRCKLSLSDVKVIWMKNGQILNLMKQRCEARSDGCFHELHLRRLTTADSGEVKLVVDCDLLDCAYLTVNKPPVRFTRDLRDQVVDLKVKVEMFCEVSDHEANVTWYRNDLSVEESQSSTDLHLSTFVEGCKRTLIIPRVLMHHEARYSCVTEDGSRTSAELFVKVPPLEFVQKLSDVSKYVGDDITFTVKLTLSEVEGEWLLDSEPLKPGKKVKMLIENELKTLRLYDVQRSSIVTYRVTKQVSSTCRLDVRERPVAIERRLSDMKIREGSDVTFECYFSKPDLQVTWFMDDDEVFPSEKFDINTDGGFQRLRVRDVRYDDEANYSCRYKHRRTSAELSVLEPRIDVVRHLDDFECREGDSCTLKCALTLPAVPVTWCKDGVPLGYEAEVDKGEVIIHSLALEDMTRSSAGSYSLICLNKTVTSCHVRVTLRPIVVVKPLCDVTITNNDDELTLICEFSKPSATAFWTRNGREIKVSDMVYSGWRVNSCALTVRAPDTDDSGRYCCVIPKHCETACDVTVTEWNLAFVQPLPESATFAEGETGLLTATLSSHVDVTDVSWFLDDVMLDGILAAELGIELTHSELTTSLAIKSVPTRMKGSLVTFRCRNLESKCFLHIISLPGPPTDVVASDQTSDVTLTWGPPSDDDASDITGYVVQVMAIDEWESVECDVTLTTEGSLVGVIQNLRPGINYWCRVAAANSLGIGEYAQLEGTLTHGEVLFFASELQDVTVEEGTSLEMWCELTRASNVEAVWKCNDVIIDGDDDHVSFYSYDDTRELVIEPVSIDNAGTYTCTLGKLTSTCVVTVRPPPVAIIRHLDDVTLLEGEELTLSCVLSRRCDVVKWYKNEEPLENSAKHQILSDDRVQLLVIEPCDVTDAASYSFQVTDREYDSTVTSKARVRVVLSDKENSETADELRQLDFIEAEDDVFESDSFDSESLDGDSESSAEFESESVGRQLDPNPETDDIVIQENLKNQAFNVNDLPEATEAITSQIEAVVGASSSDGETTPEAQATKAEDPMPKTVSFRDPQTEERDQSERLDEEAKRKRLSIASILSDAYETANESVVSDEDEEFEEAKTTSGDTKSLEHEIAHQASPVPDIATSSSEDRTSSKELVVTPPPPHDKRNEDADSVCTVSSLSSEGRKTLSPLLEEKEEECERDENKTKQEDEEVREEQFESCAMIEESIRGDAERETDDEEIIHEEEKSEDKDDLVMDLFELRREFLSEHVSAISPIQNKDSSYFGNEELGVAAQLPKAEMVFNVTMTQTNQAQEQQPDENISEKTVKDSERSSGRGSQGLVECLQQAYDSTCIVTSVERPVLTETVTRIVVDARTGETVTMSSKKLELDASAFQICTELSDGDRGPLEQMELPLETTDDKLARMFGDVSTQDEEDKQFTSLQENQATSSIELTIETSRRPTAEYDDLIDACVQALESIQETSAVALMSDSDADSHCLTKPSVEPSSEVTSREGLSPGFKEGLHNQQVVVGSSVLLQCSVAAFPEPSIVWSKEGSDEDVMRLDQQMPGLVMRQVHVAEGVLECSLELMGVTLLDAGLYSCQASNDFGRSSCSAVLLVRDESSDDVIDMSDDVPAQANALKIRELTEELPSRDVTPTCDDHEEAYTSDDDVSISMPPPSERSYSLSTHTAGGNEWAESATGFYSEDRAVQAVVENSDKMSMGSVSTQALKIHVLESIVVRETFESSDTCSQLESDTELSDDTSTPVRKKVSPARYRQVAVKCTSRPSTACLSDSEDDLGSFCSSMKTPEVYYTLRACGSGRDSATLQLTSGQPVEVMDVTSSKEWLVRTRPTKHQPVRVGFVDPAFLGPGVLTPSPAPPQIREELLPCATRTTVYETRTQESNPTPEPFQFPEGLYKFDCDVDLREYLSSTCRKRTHVAHLIVEERNFVVGLRKAIHVINNPPITSQAVESREQEIFGDLEGLENFHTSTLLPELVKILEKPQLLPHVFLKHHHTLEQLHLSHAMNTNESLSLIGENDQIYSELFQLSTATGVQMCEVPQQPAQQLVLYQYYLKKLLRYDDLQQINVRPIRDTLLLLSDIPHKARTTRLWEQMRGHPQNSQLFGRLIKEGVLATWHPYSAGGSRQSSQRRIKFRRVFLFENCLIVAKLDKVTSRESSSKSTFDQIFQTDCMLLEEDENNVNTKAVVLKSSDSRLGVALWSIALKTKTEASRKSWSREIRKAIQVTMRPPLAVLPRFTLPLCDVTVQRDDDVVLFCYLANKPSTGVMWIKDDQVIVHSDHITATERDDGYCALHVCHVSGDDAGVYRCMTASDFVDVIECSATVTVQVPPYFPRHVTDTSCTFGDVARLVCDVTGTPNPEVEWSREEEGTTIKGEAGKYDVIRNGERATLVVYDVGPDDIGRYNCKIWNVLGEARSSGAVFFAPKQDTRQFNVDTTVMRIQETLRIVERRGWPNPRHAPVETSHDLAESSCSVDDRASMRDLQSGNARKGSTDNAVILSFPMPEKSFTEAMSVESRNSRDDDSRELSSSNDKSNLESRSLTDDVIQDNNEVSEEYTSSCSLERNLPTSPMSMSESVFDEDNDEDSTISDSSDEDLNERVRWIERGETSDSEYRRGSIPYPLSLVPLRTSPVRSRAAFSSFRTDGGGASRMSMTSSSHSSGESSRMSSESLDEKMRKLTGLETSPKPPLTRSYSSSSQSSGVGSGRIVRVVRALSQNDYFDTFFDKQQCDDWKRDGNPEDNAICKLLSLQPPLRESANEDESTTHKASQGSVSDSKSQSSSAQPNVSPCEEPRNLTETPECPEEALSGFSRICEDLESPSVSREQPNWESKDARETVPVGASETNDETKMAESDVRSSRLLTLKRICQNTILQRADKKSLCLIRQDSRTMNELIRTLLEFSDSQHSFLPREAKTESRGSSPAQPRHQQGENNFNFPSDKVRKPNDTGAGLSHFESEERRSTICYRADESDGEYSKGFRVDIATGSEVAFRQLNTFAEKNADKHLAIR